jgi:ATP-binding cassette subfamily B protein
MSWADHAWTRADLPAGLAALARRAGIVSAQDALRMPSNTEFDLTAARSGNLDRDDHDLWLGHRADELGIRLEAVSARYPKLGEMLLNAAPAILRIDCDGHEGFILLTGSRGASLRVLDTDLKERRISCTEVIEAMSAGLAAAIPTDVDACVREAGIHPRRRARARDGILSECLREIPIGGCWLLRPQRNAGWTRLLHRDGIGGKALLFTGLHLAQAGLTLAAWTIVGTIAFSPNASDGWLLPLALILASIVPLQMANSWIAGLAALAFGARLKERLLTGALHLPIDEVRSGGVGRHLGRVIESDVFEGSLLAGAVTGAAALIDLTTAGLATTAGAGGIANAGLLGIWTVLVAGSAALYLHSRRRWADARLHLTHGLVERMVGHQTRLAQEHENGRHAVEDHELEAYQGLSGAMDFRLTCLSVLANRGWLPVGLAGLMPAFIRGDVGQVELAISLGSVLLAQRAFTQFANSCTVLADAIVGWRIVGPLSSAATAETGPAGSPLARQLTQRNPARAADELPPNRRNGDEPPLLEGHDLHFTYADRPGTILDGCGCKIERGDRILLQGGSGSGKSTLAAILAGLRTPAHGLLLLRGLDLQTLGSEEWRRRIALAPQFHENHILSGTLAFNLLMGSRWPASREDLLLAEALLHDLELGPLLDRMPNGIHQIVGETGWQLSHGERSRIFLARAILQSADLLILDESFAALDPETLESCLRVLFAQQRTILVIAHP